MLNAFAFVNRARKFTHFNICIDNEWFDNLTVDDAQMLLVDYEITQTVKHRKAGTLKENEIWEVDVMDWFISTIDEYTISLNVL